MCQKIFLSLSKNGFEWGRANQTWLGQELGRDLHGEKTEAKSGNDCLAPAAAQLAARGWLCSASGLRKPGVLRLRSQSASLGPAAIGPPPPTGPLFG